MRVGNSSVVVLGGGLSGAAAAWALARSGVRDVTLLERGERLGGLAGSFERDGRFYPLGYHHILHRDRTLLFFLDRIGVLPRVRWRRVRMLFRVDGRLHDLGSPAGFLRFPMAPLDKLRFVRLMLRAFAKSDWSDWEGRSAEELVRDWAGPGVERALFEPLCRLKFELPCAEVSAAWLGARLHFREGASALGYVPGANWTTLLCDGVTRLVAEAGVRVRLGAGVSSLETKDGRVREAVLEDGERVGGDVFVSTLPTEVYARLAPRDETPHLATIRYTALLSTICVTRQRVAPDFYWLNLGSPAQAACGIFLLSSLNPTIGRPGESCLNFVTHLRSRHDPRFRLPDEGLLELYRADCRDVFGFDLAPEWSNVARVPLYSPIFTTGFRNPPPRSRSYGNVWFAGNYRTFPSVASTGTALGSGLAAAAEVLEPLGLATDLPARARLFPVGGRAPA